MERIERRKKYYLSSGSRGGKISDGTERMPEILLEYNYDLELINNMRVCWT